jgi:ADP-heptose:LPS heptosyltransferase
MNRNYVEFQHHVAGLAYSKPEDMQIKFYATAVEKEEAIKFKKKQGGGKLIMWSLAGSAVHKTWAGLDNVMAAILLEYPDCHIILVGGAECKVLEAGWENEPRVIKRSGVWTMRQTLSVLPHCDLIIGPETGVLNAAACMPVPKVCILSHSTTENLTRDWTNCTPVFTKVTPCYPCHMLHYGFEHCHQDKESGTAQCQVDIPISDVVGAAMEYLK